MSDLARRLPVVLALWFGAACGADPAEDGPPDACAGATGCNGECELGNSYGVGRYCTPGGGECAGLAAAFCTVDFEDTTETWCTRPCDPEADVVEQCGEDAVCRGEDQGGGGPSGCVPMICL